MITLICVVRDGRGVKPKSSTPPETSPFRVESLRGWASVGQLEEVFDDDELDLTVHQLSLADLRLTGCTSPIANIQTYDAKGVLTVPRSMSASKNASPSRFS